MDEFVKLSWWLIEQKIMYYHPEKCHPTQIMFRAASDGDYDEAELRYIELCKELNQPNTIIHKVSELDALFIGSGMMEVDFSRPSVQKALEKLSAPTSLGSQ